MERSEIGYTLTNKNKSILLKVNERTLDFDICDRAPLDIDYNWFIEEDGLLKYAGKIYEVKAGDTVIMTYSTTDESKNLPCNEQVRELAIIEKDSNFGKLINKKRTAILEERRSYDNATLCSPSSCCDEAISN